MPQRTSALMAVFDADHCENGVWCAGFAFIGDRKLSRGDVCALARGAGEPQAWKSLAERSNGFYAIVHDYHDGVGAAVDRIRSIPLFFAIDAEKLYLSTSAEWIASAIGGHKCDRTAAAELLLTGYTTGSGTMDLRIHQLLAGETVWFTRAGGRWLTSRLRYYEFRHTVESGIPTKEFSDRLDAALVDAVRRLVSYAEGRQIVLPLSGGLDSRVLAITLRRLGYENVIAFSYGRAANLESQVSRYVASVLSIPWYFVEYTEDRWHSWYASREYSEYRSVAENLTAVAHLQDWPAVMSLAANRIINHDAVVVPGHAADFVAGSHIPPGWTSDGSYSPVDAIMSRHFVLGGYKKVARVLGVDDHELRCALRERIKEIVGADSLLLGEAAADAVEFWDWQERQAKFIANAVRVYDYVGLNWWLPFWDEAFVSFWKTPPLRFRSGKGLYNRYVADLQARFAPRMPPVNDRSGSRVSNLLPPIVRRSIRVLVPRRKHELAWDSLCRIAPWRAHPENINSHLAYDMVCRLLAASSSR